MVQIITVPKLCIPLNLSYDFMCSCYYSPSNPDCLFSCWIFYDHRNDENEYNPIEYITCVMNPDNPKFKEHVENQINQQRKKQQRKNTAYLLRRYKDA